MAVKKKATKKKYKKYSNAETIISNGEPWTYPTTFDPEVAQAILNERKEKLGAKFNSIINQRMRIAYNIKNGY